MRHEIPSEIAFVFGCLLLARAREYILSKVALDPDTGCWVWAGSGDGRYAHAWFMGVRFKAHRLSYLAFRGRIIRGRIVDHEHCDNPPCCRPSHLQACTQSANIKRCFSVGRGRSPFLKEQQA